jgi:hypothetical protein
MKALGTPKYSFKFMTTDMLLARVNIDTYILGKILPDFMIEVHEHLTRTRN